MNQVIENFLNEKKLILIGVSSRKEKFGNIVYKELSERGYEIFPVNKSLESYDNKKCYQSVELLPAGINVAIISAKSPVAKIAVTSLIEKDIKKIWFLKGSFPDGIEKQLEDNNVEYIKDKCILMYAEPVKSIHAFHRFCAKLFGKY